MFSWASKQLHRQDKKVDHSRYLIVVVNGKPMGVTDDPDKVKHQCKRYGHHITGNIKDRYLNISSDGSRLVIPLVDTKKINEHCKNLKMTFLSGSIRYVDQFELQEYDYSFHSNGSKRYSLFHAITMLGTQAAIMPFSNYTALPRNCYLSAIGVYQTYGVKSLLILCLI